MIITGERLNLRDRRIGDLSDYQRWFAPGQAWQKWDAPWEPVEPPDAKAEERWRQRLAQSPPEPRASLEIETRDGQHIGWVNSYWVSQENDWRDCGICIAEEGLWGRGLGREAFGLWLDYQMEAYDLPRIGMGTWSGNRRMIRVAARVGMRQEACFPQARLVDGQRYDAVRWGMTRAQWRRYRAPRRDGLRRYTPADWEAAVELTRQLFQHHRGLQGGPPFSPQDARETVYGWLARPDTHLWLWQEGGQTLGLARARYDGVYFVEEFVVAQRERGRGLGARFLAALEEDLRAAGEQDVFLSMVWPGNPGAIDFYRRNGYNLINTFELRKSLEGDRRGREIHFLDRPFYLTSSVPSVDLET